MRRALPAFVRAASRFACGVAFGLVIAIIALLVFESRGVLTAGFLTQPPSGLPIGREGGVGPAILGSLLLGGTACLFGSILGLSVAMRLAFGRPVCRGIVLFADDHVAIAANILAIKDLRRLIEGFSAATGHQGQCHQDDH